MRRFRRIHATIVCLSIAVPAAARAQDDERSIRDVALAMPHTIDHADWDGFSDLFTEDAVMYVPFRPEVAAGRAAILGVMEPIFERNRQRGPGPYFGFEPTDVRVQRLGDGGAAVTWTMTVGERLARRTAVLRRTPAGWKIALVHADNWGT